eukprot:4822399-Lingulodinium_polyedra.AAC.1
MGLPRAPRPPLRQPAACPPLGPDPRPLAAATGGYSALVATCVRLAAASTPCRLPRRRRWR